MCKPVTEIVDVYDVWSFSNYYIPRVRPLSIGISKYIMDIS